MGKEFRKKEMRKEEKKRKEKREDNGKYELDRREGKKRLEEKRGVKRTEDRQEVKKERETEGGAVPGEEELIPLIPLMVKVEFPSDPFLCPIEGDEILLVPRYKRERGLE